MQAIFEQKHANKILTQSLRFMTVLSLLCNVTISFYLNVAEQLCNDSKECTLRVTCEKICGYIHVHVVHTCSYALFDLINFTPTSIVVKCVLSIIST